MPLKEFKADLIPGIKEVTINVKKELLTSVMTGELASSLKGRGIEFEDFREYNPTDDAHRIDWRASQRSQKTLVREYKLDVNFNTLFMIDVSESMLFASTKQLKCEYAAEVVSSLFNGILGSGNSVGFALFSDGVKKMVKPLLGKKQFHLFTRQISDPKNYGGKRDMFKSLNQAMNLLKRKALIFIVSDFIGVEKEIASYLKIVSHVHDVIGVMVRDPLDIALPKVNGQYVLQDPFNDNTIYIDAHEYAKKYKDYNEKQIKLLRTIFHNSKAKLLELETDKSFFNPTLKFLKQMGARWR
jgi:uncharacterized protein (DUF58 family)